MGRTTKFSVVPIGLFQLMLKLLITFIRLYTFPLKLVHYASVQQGCYLPFMFQRSIHSEMIALLFY